MTLRMAEKLMKAKRVKKENTVKATCVACGRSYWATEAFEAMVKAGRLESLCGYCDGSHDDGEGDCDE